MNRSVLLGVVALAMVAAVGLVSSESTAVAGHGCAGRGAVGGYDCGGFVDAGCRPQRHHGHHRHHARRGGGLFTRLQGRQAGCCQPAPVCPQPCPTPCPTGVSYGGVDCPTCPGGVGSGQVIEGDDIYESTPPAPQPEGQGQDQGQAPQPQPEAST